MRVLLLSQSNVTRRFAADHQVEKPMWLYISIEYSVRAINSSVSRRTKN